MATYTAINALVRHRNAGMQGPKETRFTDAVGHRLILGAATGEGSEILPGHLQKRLLQDLNLHTIVIDIDQ